MTSNTTQVTTQDNKLLHKLIETYTLIALNASNVREDTARRQARIVADCVVSDLETEHPSDE